MQITKILLGSFEIYKDVFFNQDNFYEIFAKRNVFSNLSPLLYLTSPQRRLNNFLKKVFKNPISFAVYGLVGAFLLWHYSQSRMVSLRYFDHHGSVCTLQLPLQDQKKLAALMQKLFAENSFAYTIFGVKPISWETYQNPWPLSSWAKFLESFSEHNRVMRSGWTTWKKYSHIFPNSSLCAENPPCHPGLTSILIINETKLNDIINKDKRDFEKVLCREIISGFQLIQEAKNHSLMNEVLQGHQALMGIVLGYGRENAWQFFDSCNRGTCMDCVWTEADNFSQKPTDSDNLTCYYLSHYSCPSFAADPHSAESLALKKEYSLAKQRILNYYKNKDFLEATLSLLAGFSPD